LGGINGLANDGEHEVEPGHGEDGEELFEFVLDLVLQGEVLPSRVFGVLPFGADALYKQVQAVDSILLFEKAKGVNLKLLSKSLAIEENEAGVRPRVGVPKLPKGNNVTEFEDFFQTQRVIQLSRLSLVVLPEDPCPWQLYQVLLDSLRFYWGLNLCEKKLIVIHIIKKEYTNIYN